MDKAIENLTNILEISKNIVEFAKKEEWSEKDFISAINLLHSQTNTYSLDFFVESSTSETVL